MSGAFEKNGLEPGLTASEARATRAAALVGLRA
jgi:hypothetical protein